MMPLVASYNEKKSLLENFPCVSQHLMLMIQVSFFLYMLETIEKQCFNLGRKVNDFPGPLVLTIMSSHLLQCTLSLWCRDGVIHGSAGAKKHMSSFPLCVD